jgi:hypothetical protein
MEAKNDELLILNESTNYMEPIYDIDSKNSLRPWNIKWIPYIPTKYRPC